jgi:hypothetical protein
MARQTFTTSEARTALPSLVKKAARAKPSKTLRGNAVVIQARGEEPVLLLPEADVTAAEQRIAQLEEELEDIALMRVVEALTMASEGKPSVSVDDLAAELNIALG